MCQETGRSTWSSQPDSENMSKADRERLKQACKTLLASLQELLLTMSNWTQSRSGACGWAGCEKQL
jgi:tagatose-1,6-bisphosphate aldolase